MNKAVVKIGMGTFDKNTCCIWCKREFKDPKPTDHKEGFNCL